MYDFYQKVYGFLQCTTPWNSPVKLRSISGTLSALNPKNVSKGMLCPSPFISVLHSGQGLSGKSYPLVTPGALATSKYLQLGQQ